MWIIGEISPSSTIMNKSQIVRPHQPTLAGPDISSTEFDSACATSFEGDGIMLTGGGNGSVRSRVFNTSSHTWQERASMNDKRCMHSCSTVRLRTDEAYKANHDAGIVTSRIVPSVVVVGGKSGC